MDISVDIETGQDGSPEVEIRASFSCSLIQDLAEQIREIDVRYGPDRDVGPVTLILRQGELTEVLIGTQKQGDVEFYLDEFGRLIER
jgi:hypothetical protein